MKMRKMKKLLFPCLFSCFLLIGSGAVLADEDVPAADAPPSSGAVMNTGSSDEIPGGTENSTAGTDAQGTAGNTAGQETQGGSEGQDAAGSSDGQVIQGGSDGQNTAGSSDGQDIQGGSDGQDIQGGSDGQDIQGGSDGQDIAGGSEGQDIQGGSDGQDIQGGSDGQDIAGGSDGQDIQGGSEGQDIAGGSEGQDAAGSSDGQDIQGGSDGQETPGSQNDPENAGEGTLSENDAEAGQEDAGTVSPQSEDTGSALPAGDAAIGGALPADPADAPGTAAVQERAATSSAGKTTATSAAGKKKADAAPAAAKTVSAAPKKAAVTTAAKKKPVQLVKNGVYSFLTMLNPFKSMDISGASSANRANAQLYDLNNSDAQHFRITYHPKDGNYSIMNIKSGKYLDAAGGKNANGTNIQQYTGNNTLAQRWLIEKGPNGSYVIVSAMKGSKHVLDIKGGSSLNNSNVQLYAANGTKAQQFRLQPYKPSLKVNVTEGAYILSSALKSDGSAVLDISGASMNDGANVQLYRNNGTLAQQYMLTYMGSGQYRLMSCSSGRVLGTQNGKTENRTNVRQEQAADLTSQKWRIMDAGDGTVYLKAANAERYLDIQGGKTANGTNVQIYQGNGSDAQKFRLVKAYNRPVANGVYVIRPAADTSLAAEIYSSSKKMQANARIDTKTWANSQKFKFSQTADGYYTIVNCNSGHALDVAGGSIRNGGNVQQYRLNGTLAQKWLPRIMNDGTMLLINAKSGRVLDIQDGYIRGGSNLQQFGYNGSIAQRFSLQATTGTVTTNIDYSIEPRNPEPYIPPAPTPTPDPGPVSSNLQRFLNVARSWLGKNMDDGSHRSIIDIYNSVQPLPLGYRVTYDDDWCDAFVTAAGISAGVSDLIGRECGVERHVGIFQNKGIWNEDGSSTPRTGDLIVFSWGTSTQPNYGFASHIGIVEAVSNGVITTIEGNTNPKGRHNEEDLSYVARQTVYVGDGNIRGYARPNY